MTKQAAQQTNLWGVNFGRRSPGLGGQYCRPNDKLATANGVAGRKQTVHTAGLNWYVNRNVRFMFNYLHGDIAKQVSATNVGDVGAKFDAFAVRTHIAF